MRDTPLSHHVLATITAPLLRAAYRGTTLAPKHDALVSLSSASEPPALTSRRYAAPSFPHTSAHKTLISWTTINIGAAQASDLCCANYRSYLHGSDHSSAPPHTHTRSFHYSLDPPSSGLYLHPTSTSHHHDALSAPPLLTRLTRNIFLPVHIPKYADVL